jgi:hypothetical protein
MSLTILRNYADFSIADHEFGDLHEALCGAGRASYCSSVHHEAAACSPNLDARRSQHAAALDGRRKYCRLRPARGCWWQERRALRVCIALSGMGALKIVNLPAEGEAFLEQYA